MLSFGNRTMRASIAALVASVTLGAAVAPSMAADPREINRGRIGLLTGSASGTGLSIAADLARVLDGKSNLRIVPYLSSGSVANIEDLTSFRFADMALINSDALLSQRLRNPDDDRLNNINYIARLFTNEVHVITRADSGIDSLSDLVGRRFAAGEARSGTFLTASLLLRATGVRATAIAMPTDAGFDALADGTVDAVFMLAAKPSAFLRKITSEENLALVQVPITENIRSVYKPGEFTSVDYPGLVRDKFVETVSVDVILAAYGNAPEGSDKYRRIHAFVSELERNGAQFLRPPSHPKWQQFSFDEEVGDLPRNAAAVAALSGEEAVKTDRPSILDLMRQGVDQ